MQAVTTSQDFPLKSEGVRSYLSVEFTGHIQNKEYETALKAIYRGELISDIRKQFTTEDEQHDFDRYVIMRGNYEEALQTAIYHGVPLSIGFEIELNGGATTMKIQRSKIKWTNGLLFTVFILSQTE